MIKTKDDLKYYLQEDRRGNKPPKFYKRFLGSEVYPVYSYFKNLRYLEYYLNNLNDGRLFYRLLFRCGYARHLLKHNRARLKTNIYVAPNVFGPGVFFVHPGFLRADSWCHVGANCTVLPNVLFGKKSPDVDFFDVHIGNNCYISTNVTILGPVRIGNNVTIGAGAVVNKDVPDNCIVGGVPAKIIKYKKQ
jgi:serine O-acetyltransferase